MKKHNQIKKTTCQTWLDLIWFTSFKHLTTWKKKFHSLTFAYMHNRQLLSVLWCGVCMMPRLVIPGMSTSLHFCINIHQCSVTINIFISNRYIKQSSFKFLPMKSPTRPQNIQEYFYYYSSKTVMQLVLEFLVTNVG